MAYNALGVDILIYIKKIADILSQAFKYTFITNEIVNQSQNFPAFYDQSLLIDTSAAKYDFNFVPTSISNWLSKVVNWCKKYGEKFLENEET